MIVGVPVTRAEREDGVGLRRAALVLAWTVALAVFVAVVALLQPNDLLIVGGALLLILLPSIALGRFAGLWGLLLPAPFGVALVVGIVRVDDDFGIALLLFGGGAVLTVVVCGTLFGAFLRLLSRLADD